MRIAIFLIGMIFVVGGVGAFRNTKPLTLYSRTTSEPTVLGETETHVLGGIALVVGLATIGLGLKSRSAREPALPVAD